MEPSDWHHAGNQKPQPVISTTEMQLKPGFRVHLTIYMAKPEVNQSRKGDRSPSRSVALKTVKRAVQREIHGLGFAGVGAGVCTTV